MVKTPAGRVEWLSSPTDVGYALRAQLQLAATPAVAGIVQAHGSASSLKSAGFVPTAGGEGPLVCTEKHIADLEVASKTAKRQGVKLSETLLVCAAADVIGEFLHRRRR
jgi:hypothetical protein